MKDFLFVIVCILIAGILFLGCRSTRGNAGRMSVFSVAKSEAEWIRNGEPIEFEGEMWYPVDGIEGLQDSEVYILGEYRGVQYFVDKVDVRPYDRLYTKFDKNKFRYFEKRKIQ